MNSWRLVAQSAISGAGGISEKTVAMASCLASQNHRVLEGGAALRCSHLVSLLDILRQLECLIAIRSCESALHPQGPEQPPHPQVSNCCKSHCASSPVRSLTITGPSLQHHPLDMGNHFPVSLISEPTLPPFHRAVWTSWPITSHLFSEWHFHLPLTAT